MKTVRLIDEDEVYSQKGVVPTMTRQHNVECERGFLLKILWLMSGETS
jgi:hypothetical protein